MESESEKQSVQNVAPSMNFPSGPYIHWIHCNCCYEQYMHKSRIFYLLACEHVACQQCVIVNSPTIFKCPLCRQQVAACKMDTDMPWHLKELFHPEYYLDGLSTSRIITFQEKHRRLFMDYLDSRSSALQAYKKQNEKVRENTKKLYQDLETTKAERKRLEHRAILIKNQHEKNKKKRSNSSFPTMASSTGATPKIPLQGPRMPAPTGLLFNSSFIKTFSPPARRHNFTL